MLELRYEEAQGAAIQRFGRLFDVSRADPAGFSPPKYHTAYDALVDRAMMERMDAVLAAEPGLTFALPFDLNAFAPAHNSAFSKAITGDPAQDLAGNRTKRFFLDSPALVAPRAWSSASSCPRRCSRAADRLRPRVPDRARGRAPGHSCSRPTPATPAPC